MSLFQKTKDLVLDVISNGNKSIIHCSTSNCKYGMFCTTIIGTGFGFKTQSFDFLPIIYKILNMKDPSVLRLMVPWEIVKERMKDNDISLTDDDLEYIPGKEEELIQRLEKIMNRSHDQVIAYIESISSNEDLAG